MVLHSQQRVFGDQRQRRDLYEQRADFRAGRAGRLLGRGFQCRRGRRCRGRRRWIVRLVFYRGTALRGRQSVGGVRSRDLRDIRKPGIRFRNIYRLNTYNIYIYTVG